jgi:formate dehydrogenase major subunit
MIHIKIDGKELEVPEGTTVLNAARQAGVDIPTLCDHPALEPYGGCRLCLVEVEGARTLQPACTMPAGNNMVVHTTTEKVKSARKFVLSMIFSERNHFCMYCQVSGGDCELQNAAYGEDMTHWPIQPNWQPYEVDASHPYFVMDHNRCILCRRCVRACAELSGNFTLGMEERGAKTILVADLGIPLGDSSCISCGSCIQVCPTGALIDRWSAYLGKDKDTQSTQTVCIGCSIGCGIEVLSRNNNLVRVEGNWDAEVNGGVLCEVGRFLPMVEERDRIVTPMVRKDGKLKAATWEEALNILAEKYQPLIGQANDGVAAMVSTRLPAEVLYTFKQVFADKFGSNMVTSTDEEKFAALNSVKSEVGAYEGTLTDLEEADAVMTVGIDLTKDHQVAGFFIKRAIPNGTKVIPVNYEANGMDAFTPYATKINKNADLAFVKVISASLNNEETAELQNKAGIDTAEIEKISSILKSAEKSVLVYGADFIHPEETLRALVKLAKETNSKLLGITGKANSTAAAQYHLDKPFVMNGHQSAMIVLGDEEPTQAMIKKVENSPYLVVLSSFHSALTAKANVVLPVTTWLEQDGHYVNIDGKIQEAHKSLQSPIDVKSNLDVLELLAAKLNLELSAESLAATEKAV